MITSSVTLPELATKNPLAQRCLPQHALFRWLYSCNSFRDALPLDPLHQITRRHVRRAGDEQVNMVLADVTLEDLYLQLRTDRPHDLPQPDGRRPPRSNFLRYFVIHTRWNLMSKRVWAVRR